MKDYPAKRRDVGDVLTIGFATALTMWGVGYFSRLPGAHVPAALVFALLVAVLLFGGYTAGRLARRPVRGGILAGVATGAVNLLILGSLFRRDPNQPVVPTTLWWIPASILVSGAITGAGAIVGRAFRRAGPPSIQWSKHFVSTAAVATLLLLAVGGVVTGYNAGLAVADWPGTFGNMMFLYPLAHMTGGVYYEHAHRLFGSLVGLTTVVLAFYLQFNERDHRVRVLGWIAVVAVVIQGVMGGLRVTETNVALAIVHGVFAQLFFSLLIAIRVLVRAGAIPQSDRPVLAQVATDRPLTFAFFAVMLVQLAFGALLRHLGWGVMTHITFAAIVLVLAIAVGLRFWGLYSAVRGFGGLGLTILAMAGLQVLLGFGALVATRGDANASPSGFDVFMTTAHQTNGALLLAHSVIALLRVRVRVRAPTPPREPSHARAAVAASAAGMQHTESR
jgi:cytochrome c oxidase assembly protein subunit 15